jgi:hypothetical protein
MVFGLGSRPADVAFAAGLLFAALTYAERSDAQEMPVQAAPSTGEPATDSVPAHNPKPTTVTKEVEGKARAEFAAAEKDFTDYESIKIQSNADSGDYGRKFAAMNALNAKYRAVAERHVPDLEVAALCRQGDTLKHYADSLRQADCPANVRERYQPDGCTVFKEALAEKIKSMRSIAADMYRQALDRAKNAGVKGEWVRRAAQQLKQASQSK